MMERKERGKRRGNAGMSKYETMAFHSKFESIRYKKNYQYNTIFTTF